MVKIPETKLNALVTIADYSLNDTLINLYKKNHMPIYLLTHGYGSAKSVIYDILGYGGPKKIIAISIQSESKSNYIMNQMNHKIGLSKPGTGIAFTINLSSVSSVLSKICEHGDENLKIGSEDMAIISKNPYHLIVTIVNSGCFDQVMEAAKAAGANGGTVVHARGLGSKDAMKYLGITIEPEREIVLILTPKDKKLPIMESIMHEVGLNTPALGICFSLPVDCALGLGTNIDKLDKAK